MTAAGSGQQRLQPLLDQTPLSDIGAELERPLELISSSSRVPGPPQQLGPGRMEGVISVEIRSTSELMSGMGRPIRLAHMGEPPTWSVPTIHPSAVVLPSAQIHGRVTIAADAFVLFGVVIRAEFDQVAVGAGSNVQDNAVIHCDEGAPTEVGQRVTIGHGAVVHGAVVGDRALVGIRAVVLNRATLGEGAWLAAGSVLPEGHTVPPWTLAMGTAGAAGAGPDARRDRARRRGRGPVSGSGPAISRNLRLKAEPVTVMWNGAALLSTRAR